MTIYISLPITGYDQKERQRLAEWCRRYALLRHPEATVVTPFDIAAKVEALNPKPTYEDYMKEDIAFLLQFADAVFFYGNPRLTKSKGMKLEWHAARIYHKKRKRIKSYGRVI